MKQHTHTNLPRLEDFPPDRIGCLGLVLEVLTYPEAEIQVMSENRQDEVPQEFVLQSDQDGQLSAPTLVHYPNVYALPKADVQTAINDAADRGFVRGGPAATLELTESGRHHLKQYRHNV